MKTSLIIPFRNEREYVELTLGTLHACLSGAGLDFEMVAVDDSSDGTWEILQRLRSTYSNLVVIRGGEFPGYGKALKSGFETASGDFLIPFNGDLSDNPEDVLRYVALLENGFDMVFGSRYLNPEIMSPGIVKSLASRLGNWLLRLVFDADCSDITNSFKAYRRSVLDHVQPTSDGYPFSMELALKAIRHGYRYTTIPVDWRERQFGKSKMSLVRSIPRFLVTLLRVRFT